jgi:hypothetical protein
LISTQKIMGKTIRNTKEKLNLKKTDGLIIHNKIDCFGNESCDIYSINKNKNWETIPEFKEEPNTNELRKIKLEKQKENKEKKKIEFKNNLDCHIWNNKKTTKYDFINDMPVNRKLWCTNPRTDPVLLESLK